MDEFDEYIKLKQERMHHLEEMTSFFDQTGVEPHEKDIEKIMELDKAIMDIVEGDSEIYEDRSGVFWLGTLRDGLIRFDTETGESTCYKYEAGNPRSLSSNIVSSILEDRSGTLWIATETGGLNKFDREEGTFSALTSMDGLPTNIVLGILEVHPPPVPEEDICPKLPVLLAAEGVAEPARMDAQQSAGLVER